MGEQAKGTTWLLCHSQGTQCTMKEEHLLLSFPLVLKILAEKITSPQAASNRHLQKVQRNRSRAEQSSLDIEKDEELHEGFPWCYGEGEG